MKSTFAFVCCLALLPLHLAFSESNPTSEEFPGRQVKWDVWCSNPNVYVETSNPVHKICIQKMTFQDAEDIISQTWILTVTWTGSKAETRYQLKPSKIGEGRNPYLKPYSDESTSQKKFSGRALNREERTTIDEVDLLFSQSVITDNPDILYSVIFSAPEKNVVQDFKNIDKDSTMICDMPKNDGILSNCETLE